MLLQAIRGLLMRLLGRAQDGRDGARRRRRRRRRDRRERPATALGTFGARMGRHAGIYGGGQAASLLLGLASLAVLTRFLEPAQFGRYAIYYVFAALLSMLYTLGWVRGTLMWVFGGPGGDDDDDDEGDEAADERPLEVERTAEDKRAALGSGIVLIALIGLLGSAIVAALASPVAEALVGDDGEAGLVALAGVAGATGGVTILASAVPRRERRPQLFVLLQLLRPLLVLAVTVPLVVADPDVRSAVIGLAAGNVVAAAITLAAVRRSFRLTLRALDVRQILRGGLLYAPLIVSLFVIANGGVILLGQYEAPSEVGLFRVATGVGALASLPVAAFVTAWGPLRREPIYGAVAAERGKLAASGVLASYFVLSALGILLALTLGADLLVRVAPSAYSDAAPLIPLVGLGLLLYGGVRVLRRSAQFPNKRALYITLVGAAGVVFVAASLLLIPPLGTHGAALAIVIAFLFAVVGIGIRSQTGPAPIPFAVGRIAAGLAVAVACYAAATLLGAATGDLSPAVDVAAIAAYPVLLVALRIVPPAHVAPLRKVATAMVSRRTSDGDGRVELDGIADVDRAALELLVRHRRPLEEVAPAVGLPRAVLEARVVDALRKVAGLEPAPAADPRIAAYLLSSAPVAARDQVWRRLAADGADALEVDALSITLERLRRAPAETWRRR